MSILLLGLYQIKNIVGGRVDRLLGHKACSWLLGSVTNSLAINNIQIHGIPGRPNMLDVLYSSANGLGLENKPGPENETGQVRYYSI